MNTIASTTVIAHDRPSTPAAPRRRPPVGAGMLPAVTVHDESTGARLRRVAITVIGGTASNSRMGRHSKGPRQLVAATRVHPEFVSLIEREAERIGCSKSDFVAHALALALDVPQFDPLARADQEQQLDMTA